MMQERADYVYGALLFLLVILVCSSLLSFGFFSIDEESYSYLSRSIVRHHQFHFPSDYSSTHSELHRVHLSVISRGKVFSVFAPGYSMLSAPWVWAFGLKGMQIANVFFTCLLILIFYGIARLFYPPRLSFLGACFLLLGTQVLNYSVSSFSHIAAMSLLFGAFGLMFKKRVGWAGLLFGLSLVVRYSGVVCFPFFLFYVFSRKRNHLLFFLVMGFLGILPLLLYNQICFGSPMISGMTLFNADQGYQVFQWMEWPKRLFTNLIHYTLFPKLELYANKGALLETSSFLALVPLGFYGLWRERKDLRLESFTLFGSGVFFVSFLSATWSLGGVAHNMRLLTDVLPILVLFSLPALKLFDFDKPKMLLLPIFISIFLIFMGIPLVMLFWLNLVLSLILFSLSFFSFRRWEALSEGRMKSIMAICLSFAIGASISSVIATTRVEGLIRTKCRLAAQKFGLGVREGTVIFTPGYASAAYSERNYTFLDYSYKPKDIERMMRYYRSNRRLIQVIYRSKKDQEMFRKIMDKLEEGR